MSDRAKLSKLPTYVKSKPAGAEFVGSSVFPQGLVEAIRRYDPAGLLFGTLQNAGARPGQEHLLEVSAEQKVHLAPVMARCLGNKRIQYLSGEADKLVPYHCGEPFLTWLRKMRRGGVDGGNRVDWSYRT